MPAAILDAGRRSERRIMKVLAARDVVFDVKSLRTGRTASAISDWRANAAVPAG